MSMLAEKKRKQKWCLNPQGKYWSDDSNKFGQKMLERMGWKEGKGLGRNEDGLTEHIKVAFKNDSKGIGFQESIEWSLQQDNFNTLLQELSNSKQDYEHQPKSLEKKSENSRVRVHYKKFTRGKDLSQYTEKDLANILGKKELKNKIVEKESVTDEIDKFSNNTVNKGSMIDYFKNKMHNYRIKENDSFQDEYSTVGLGFSNESGGTEELNKKSKKAKTNSFVSYITSDSEITASKKRRKGTELGLCNPAFEPFTNNVVVKRHFLDTIVEETEIRDENINPKRQKVEEQKESTLSIKKKSKKLKKDQVKNITCTNLGLINPTFDLNTTEPPKTKKKKKSKNDFNTENIDTNHNLNAGKPKKKSKNKLNEYKGIDNPALNDSNLSLLDVPDCDAISNVVNEPELFKTKKKKSKNEFIKTENIDTILDIPNSEKPNKKSKNKSNKCKGIDNPTLNDSNLSLSDVPDCDVITNVVNEPKPFKTKKKKSKNEFIKTENIDTGLDIPNSEKPNKKSKHKLNKCKDINNPALNDSNLSSSDIPSCDIMMNVVDEPVKCNNVNKNEIEQTKPTRFNKYKHESVINKPPPQKKNSKKHGIYNQGFDVNSQKVEEDVDCISSEIDKYQAEVENTINDSKVKGLAEQYLTIGSLNDSDGENEKHEEGVLLRFKHAHFNKREPVWARRLNDSISGPKKSYKHLIKGDIIVGFKDSNLHKINGYGVKL